MALSRSRLEKVRARLDLPTVRAASGLLEGRHRSIFSGHGQDFDDMALYNFGDDVSDIDWKASASTGVPVIRRFVKDSNMAMVLAVDTGRNMGATAPSGQPKSEIAMFAAEVVCYLAHSRNDTVALVAGDSDRITQLPARSGNQHMELLLRRLEMMFDVESPESDLERILNRILTWFTRRSLVVVITDEARPLAEHETAIKRLRTRHEVMFINIADLRPTDLSNMQVDDVDYHLDIPEYLKAHPALIQEVQGFIQARRSAAEAILRRRGVQGVIANSEDDLIDALIDLLRRQKRVGR